MKTATYYQPEAGAFGPKELHILAEHKDGTVDLGNEDGPVLVERCPVGGAGTPGTCFIGGATPTPAVTGDDTPEGGKDTDTDPGKPEDGADPKKTKGKTTGGKDADKS